MCPAGLPKSVSSLQFKSLAGKFVIKFLEMIYTEKQYIFSVYKYTESSLC